MKLPPLTPAVFISRPNRFIAVVAVAGRETLAHVPNSGRLAELLAPGRALLLANARRAGRKTAYDLALARLDGGGLASADARLPARLVAEAIAERRLPPFAGYTSIRAEPRLGDSRLDLRLDGPDGRDSTPASACYIEVKSITLVAAGVGLFPDCPTARGRRHLAALMAAKATGHRAAVVFVVQRPDAVAFAPNDDADPAFGAALRRAAAAAVEVYAYRCAITETEARLTDELPVLLDRRLAVARGASCR